jgi:hypothetical protein
MFRRPFGRPFRRIQVGRIPPALQRANQFMASGLYAEAAGIYEQFAAGALARNGPRAPWFFLLAAQARLLSGQVPAGMAHLRQGLALFAGRGQFQRLYHTGMRFAAELKGRGLTAEAQQIDDYHKATLPSGFTPATGTGKEKPKPVLPTTCPRCGGPIRSDEVEWPDEVTAECPYCGSAVRAQG